MRILPPKTNRKTFNHNQFKEYLFQHVVVGREEAISLVDFWKELLEHYRDKEQAFEVLISMFPTVYKHKVGEIFEEEGLI